MQQHTADADLLVQWVRQAFDDLGRARTEIDALNVFPVPDGDTGTNMYLTMESAVLALDSMDGSRPTGHLGEVLRDADPELQRFAAVAQAIGQGALMGARGNSGVILSQILRGIFRVDPELAAAPQPDGILLSKSLSLAAEMAYAAVAHPVEGTMLTVIREAAEAAEAALPESPELLAVATAAGDGAHRALRRTPQMLPALAEAGVVDSGGRGIVVILDSLLDILNGQKRPHQPYTRPEPIVADEHQPHIDYDGPAYEVMYLLESEPSGKTIPAMQEALDRLGDSLVVVGGDGLWNVHVHVDDAGAAVEAAMAAGRPFRIRITWLRSTGADQQAARLGRALVAVSHGPGVAALLSDSGVIAVPARPRVSPSTGEFVSAIESSGAAEVVLLPGSKDITPAAEAAADRARRQGVRVAVVPTRAVVQTLAAIAVHDAERGFDDDVVAMSRAAGATRYGAVTVSSKRAVTTAGVCMPGDVLGLVDGDIALIEDDERVAAFSVLDRLVSPSSELVTLLAGADMEDADLAELTHESEERFPWVEVVSERGGQPLWPLIVGVE